MPAQPKQIRKIAFVYKLDYMPAPLIVGFHQMEKRIEQAQLTIKVALVPLNELDADWDIAFVPKEIAHEIGSLSGQIRIQVEEFVNHPSYTELISQLEAGTELCAGRTDPNQPADTIVRYRGYDRIE